MPCPLFVVAEDLDDGKPVKNAGSSPFGPFLECGHAPALVIPVATC